MYQKQYFKRNQVIKLSKNELKIFLLFITASSTIEQSPREKLMNTFVILPDSDMPVGR